MRGARGSSTGAGLRVRVDARTAPCSRARAANVLSRGGLALSALAMLACGPSARTVALQQVQAPAPRERIQGLRALAKLGKPDDDELWVAIERLTRDRSVHVRIAAAEALANAPKSDEREPDQRGALADDALSAELSDLDETARIAAARVLGSRCNPRAIAYLHGAFTRSGPAVRAQVAESLGRCGVPLDQVLARSEEVRRRHALEKLDSNIAAWRATAARELGMLGRPEDVAKLGPLLDDRDGTVAAAAAEGLGLAGAESASAALQRLAGDPVPLISMAAIDALAALGPAALAGAEPTLVQRAEADGEQAVTAAAALLEAGHREVICAAALQAKVPAAAALLARGCPIAPFAEALGELVPAVPRRGGHAAKSASAAKGSAAAKGDATRSAQAEKSAPMAARPMAARGPQPEEPGAALDPRVAGRAAALLEALAQAGQGEAPSAAGAGQSVGTQNIGTPNVGTPNIGTQTISDQAALALGRLAEEGDPDLAVRAAQLAGELGAKAAVPALLAVAAREKAALVAGRAAQEPAAEDRAAAARALAEAATRAPAADGEKVARLMAMVRARQEKEGAAAKPDAAARLRQLLAGDPPDASAGSPHARLLAACLRTALALDPTGAKELAESLRDDPDAALAAAARAPPLAPEAAPSGPAPDCFPPPPDLPASVHGDAGPPAELVDLDSPEEDSPSSSLPSYVVRAPTRAAKAGCLDELLAQGPHAPVPAGAVASARASLWSDAGAERAAACKWLALISDSESAPLRGELIHDPERRVRVACNASGETAPPGRR